jgi:hypothetical protein
MQPLYWSLEDLPGLSKDDRAKLKACGIDDTQKLLQKTSTPALQQILATKLQIHPQYLKKWVALADLACIPSVGCQYCGLLLHSGICSVSQLTQTPVYRLQKQILRLQVGMMQRRDLCPTVAEIQQWIKEARFVSSSDKSS